MFLSSHSRHSWDCVATVSQPSLDHGKNEKKIVFATLHGHGHTGLLPLFVIPTYAVVRLMNKAVDLFYLSW